MKNSPHNKTYREHLRKALSLDNNFTPKTIEKILDMVANDEGLKRIIPCMDVKMDNTDFLTISWECTKLYAHECFQTDETPSLAIAREDSKKGSL